MFLTSLRKNQQRVTTKSAALGAAVVVLSSSSDNGIERNYKKQRAGGPNYVGFTAPFTLIWARKTLAPGMAADE